MEMSRLVVSAALLFIVACCSDVALGRVTSIPHRGALYDGLAMRALNHHNIPAVSADAPEQWFTQVPTPTSRSMHRCAVPRKPSQANI